MRQTTGATSRRGRSSSQTSANPLGNRKPIDGSFRHRYTRPNCQCFGDVIERHGGRSMDILKVATDTQIIGDVYRSMLQDSPSLSFGKLLTIETDPLLAKTSRMAASGHARPSIPEYFKVSRQLQAMFEAVISDSTPVKEIVRRTAEFVSVISSRDLGHS